MKPTGRTFAVAAALVVVACGGDRLRPGGGNNGSGPGSGGISLEGLTSIDISPATAQVVVTNGLTSGTDFVATGTFADGTTKDITRSVSWAVNDPSLGAVTAGHFDVGQTPLDHGGSTTVVASGNNIASSALIKVKYQIIKVSNEQGSSAPQNSDQQFASATADPNLSPNIVYPLDLTRMPSNVNGLEIQWSTSQGFAGGLLFEVSIDHPSFGLKAYTNSALNNGGRYTLLPQEWTSLAQTIGDESVIVSVRALQNGRVGTSKSLRIEVAKEPLQGGIYYWSNPGTAAAPYQPSVGVIRRDFGDVNAVSQPFYTGATVNQVLGSSGECAGCHALSRDGKKMAISYTNDKFTIVDVATKQPLMAMQPSGVRIPFPSFSPDGNKLIRHTQSYNQLEIIDSSGGPSTGMVLQTLSSGGTWMSHPDWSPDGKSIAISQQTVGYASPWEMSRGSIVLATDDGSGNFAITQTLVETGGEDNYYPSFSPDSKWILFNRSASGSSYNNTGAEVWVVAADGSVPATRLDFANSGNSLTNSWPRWTPFVTKFGPMGKALYYFTFSSKRDYGLELQGTGRSQIWMASFNPDGLTSSVDSGESPSSAPFWVPFQDPMTSNHNAQWVQTIVPSIN